MTKTVTNPKVTVVILNYNHAIDTIECLRSLESVKYPNYEIVVVDNGSTDGSLKKIKEAFPSISLINNHKNLGFAEGNNVGIRYAMNSATDYVFLLNDDTIVDKGCIDRLVTVGESADNIGVIGPIVCQYGKRDKVYAEYGVVSYREAVTTLVGYGRTFRKNINQPKDVDFVIGCAFMIKRKAIEKVGLLDSQYFAYHEEVDWCMRTKANGFRVVYVPDVIVWHKGAASTGGEDYSNLVKRYLVGRNSVIFMKKHGSVLHWTKFIFFVIITLPLAFIRECFFGNPRAVLAKIQGYRDGFIGIELDHKVLERFVSRKNSGKNA